MNAGDCLIDHLSKRPIRPQATRGFPAKRGDRLKAPPAQLPSPSTSRKCCECSQLLLRCSTTSFSQVGARNKETFPGYITSGRASSLTLNEGRVARASLGDEVFFPGGRLQANGHAAMQAIQIIQIRWDFMLSVSLKGLDGSRNIF